MEERGESGNPDSKHRRRNAPSTLYCVPNHLSLRGQRPSCSGDNSIRLAFSGVSRDKAALITYTHTEEHCLCETQYNLAVNQSARLKITRRRSRM